MSKIIGAILCGGEGRTAGCHKAGLVQPNGLTIIENIYNAIDTFCQETVLVGHAQDVPDSLGHLKNVPDNYSHCGPMGALEAILNSDLGDLYMIAPCQEYAADPRIYDLLLMHEKEAPLVVRQAGQTFPLLGLFPANLRTLATQHIAYDTLELNSFLQISGTGRLDLPLPATGGEPVPERSRNLNV